MIYKKKNKFEKLNLNLKNFFFFKIYPKQIVTTVTY